MDEDKHHEFGARPIVRLVRNEIEDKITEMIIRNEPEEGHVFKFSEIG